MTITSSPRVIECHLHAYIARDNPSAANRITSALLEAIKRLANFMIWRRRYPEHRTREAEVAEAVELLGLTSGRRFQRWAPELLP